MADSIKGLTVKIGADTKDFVKGLKSADKQINATQKQAIALQKGLELEFDESRFIQTQKQFQKALGDTEQKAEAIRKQLKFLEDTGAVDTAGYQQLQTELAKTETKALQLKEQLEKVNAIKLDKLSNSFKNVGGKIESAGQKMKVVSGLALGVGAGMLKLGNDAREVGDKIATMSSQYDLSTKSIQRFNYIALQSDVPAEKLFKGANKIRDALGSQMRGEVNAQTKALSELNVKMSDFKNTEDAFDATIKSLSSVTDKTLQYNLAVDLFGDKVATDILPLLGAGEDAIQGWVNEFEEVGYITDEQVQNLAELDGAMDRANEQFNQAKLQLGVALIPVLEIFTELLTEKIIPFIEKLTEKFESMDSGMFKVVIGALGMIAALSPLLILIGKIVKAVGFLIPLMAKLKIASLGAAAGIGALVGGLALGVDLIANWSKMSTVEKILKSLALAALVAAAAITVFHSSWSLGLAVGGIVAGITAGVAAINSARKKILPKSDDITFDNISSTTTPTYSTEDYTIPTIDRTQKVGDVINDNSTTEINITLTPTGELNYDVKQLADAVNQELVNRKLSYR